jgi:hypothetical protein
MKDYVLVVNVEKCYRLVCCEQNRSVRFLARRFTKSSHTPENKFPVHSPGYFSIVCGAVVVLKWFAEQDRAETKKKPCAAHPTLCERKTFAMQPKKKVKGQNRISSR